MLLTMLFDPLPPMGRRRQWIISIDSRGLEFVYGSNGAGVWFWTCEFLPEKHPDETTG